MMCGEECGNCLCRVCARNQDNDGECPIGEECLGCEECTGTVEMEEDCINPDGFLQDEASV